MSDYKLECGCGYELVEDGSVQRIREFHEPGCDGRPPSEYAPRFCGCKLSCGDLPEAEDHRHAVCRGLRR